MRSLCGSEEGQTRQVENRTYLKARTINFEFERLRVASRPSAARPCSGSFFFVSRLSVDRYGSTPRFQNQIAQTARAHAERSRAPPPKDSIRSSSSRSDNARPNGASVLSASGCVAGCCLWLAGCSASSSASTLPAACLLGSVSFSHTRAVVSVVQARALSYYGHQYRVLVIQLSQFSS